MLTDICWKKTSEENYLLQCICKFNNILCTVPALKKLFQYALKKKKTKTKFLSSPQFSITPINLEIRTLVSQLHWLLA